MQRFKNLYILLLCLGYGLIKGKANRPRSVKKSIVVQFGKMGDMVCATPLFHALKKNGFQVTVLGKGLGPELLDGNHDVDNYQVYKGNFWQSVRLVRNHKFDFGCVTSPNFVGLAILYLGNVKFIVAPQIYNGRSPYETSLYRFLRKLVATAPHQMGNYAPGEYLKLLEPVNIQTSDTTKHLSCSQGDLNFVYKYLDSHNLDTKGYIIIAPSAGNAIKRWPPDRFAQLADRIKSKYDKDIVIIGSKSDQTIADQMSSLMSTQKKINVAGIFNVAQLKALVSQAVLVIAVDSGPIYIAEAFNVPTVDIIGPIDEKEQPPIGPKHKIVLPNREKPELYVMNAGDYNPTEARRQVEDISVDMVMAQVEQLL